MAEAAPGHTAGYMMDREPVVKPFSYTGSLLAEFESLPSPARLSPYIRDVGGDRDRAMRLYTWNTAISAAFYGLLQGLEVALRNAMHRRLAERYETAWYDNPDSGLDQGAIRRVANARTALKGGANGPSEVAAALSFGFWVSLLGPGGRLESGNKADYEKALWRPALRGAFPHRRSLTRKQAYMPLNDLRYLRNRIAHHEPIFMRNLDEEYERILDVTGWISPAKREWIAYHGRIPGLPAVGPDADGIRF